MKKNVVICVLVMIIMIVTLVSIPMMQTIIPQFQVEPTEVLVEPNTSQEPNFTDQTITKLEKKYAIVVDCLDNQIAGLLDNKDAWEEALGLPSICLEFLPEGYAEAWADEHLNPDMSAKVDQLEQTNIELKKDLKNSWVSYYSLWDDVVVWIDKAEALQNELNTVKIDQEPIRVPDPIKEPNFTDLVQTAIKSVVHIRCPQWQGSGFIIDEHIIATARHVVEGVEEFTISQADGTVLHATRAISAKDYDIAFIWSDVPLENIAPLGSIEGCKLGQDVFIVGSPYGDINFNSVSKGIISGLNRNWDEVNPYTGERYGWEIAFTSDSAAHPGNSGGAVFTMDGVVRGVLVGGFSPVLNCSMPCDLFLYDLDEIRRMFIMDKYEREVEVDIAEEVWGY